MKEIRIFLIPSNPGPVSATTIRRRHFWFTSTGTLITYTHMNIHLLIPTSSLSITPIVPQLRTLYLPLLARGWATIYLLKMWPRRPFSHQNQLLKQLTITKHTSTSFSLFAHFNLVLFSFICLNIYYVLFLSFPFSNLTKIFVLNGVLTFCLTERHIR